MKSETPSPIPPNTRNIPTSTTNQPNFQNAHMQLINPFLLTTNPPIPTPSLTPTFRGFTPTTNSTVPTFIPINQLPQHTVIRPVTPRIPAHHRITTTTSTNISQTDYQFYPPHITAPSTIDQNRDLQIQPPPNYPNLFPQNHFLTQSNLLPSNYRFSIPHDNLTHDTLIGKITRMTSYYNHWFSTHHQFSHFQFNFLKPTKLDYINLPLNSLQYSQIMNAKRAHQFSYETFYNHHYLNSTNQNYLFTSTKYSSPYSLHAEYHLDSIYCYGRIRQYDPIKDYFLYYSNANPDRPLIVPEKPFPHTIHPTFISTTPFLQPRSLKLHLPFSTLIFQPLFLKPLPTFTTNFLKHV